MIDKIYCMSSYLALRYIENDDIDFFNNCGKHKNIPIVPENEKILVDNSNDIDNEIRKQIDMFSQKKLGILLSGGMDSAIVASYLTGSDAYTFRFLNGEFQKEELKKAEYYAQKYKLNLHYVDINFDVANENLDIIMKNKCAPVHSIEPQIYKAAIQAKNDGVEVMFVGESSDLVFGGMDKLLSKDWDFDEFMNRYIFINPEKALKEYVSMQYVFERYRLDNNKIDFMKFMDDIFSVESSSSYFNAFQVANLEYYDPYAKLKMKHPLDLYRVRNGEPKYLIRELFSTKYLDIAIPDKTPMPRPVDFYFKDWAGPSRTEFRNDLNINNFDGNQKWQLYCLERFLNLYS